MKNKSNIKKTISIIIKAIVLIIFLYSLIFVVRSGKQRITIKTVSNFYSGSELDAIVEVSDKKTDEKLKGNLTAELLDSKGKKVKGVKEHYKIEAGETADISLQIPENLESGRYDLKVTSRTGIFKISKEVTISIISEKSTETIISLDKGIYKPGDEVNFRALVISKKDNTPIVSNNVSISIYDGNNNRVYFEDVTTSEFGIVSGNFKLSDVVNSGTYKLKVSTVSEEVTKEFIVNPYITPKFDVSVTTDKENYMVGEDANVTISAKYFFGEAVTNASIKGTINNKEFTGLTNENGDFTKRIKVTEEGAYNISFSIEDSSNYFVEASKTFYGANGAFEIEILSEFDDIIKGLDNEIYVITKTVDNKPVKTYMTANIGNITREVITDENGIGKIVLSSSDIANLSSKINIFVKAEDMSGNEITKTENLTVVNNYGTIIKTDKVKYEENENINVSLISTLDNQTIRTIYVFKNNELVKTISFEGEEIEFNLEGIYGLVDICIEDSTSSLRSIRYNYYNNYHNYTHKTIFIKPTNALNINVETDKDVYAPKDTLNVSFAVTNENNETSDSALLVSILDEAILSLADNDLSLDNLKVALNDIELSDGITAADLYAIILDDSNTTTLNSILLKQNSQDNQIVTRSSYNTDITKQKIALFITSILIVIFILQKIFKKYEKFRKIVNSFVIALIDIFAIGSIIAVYGMPIIMDIFYYVDSYVWMSIAVCAVLSIVIYNLILYKEKMYIFNLVLDLIIVPGIIIAILSLLFEISEIVALLVLLALLLVLTLLSVVSRKRELNKFWSFIKELVLTFVKSIVFWCVTVIICNFMDSQLGFLVTLAIYVLYEKFILKKTNTKMKDGKIIFNVTANELIGIYTGIIFVFMIIMFLNIIKGFSSNITVDEVMVDDSASLSWGTSDFTFGDIDTSASDSVSSSLSTEASSKFEISKDIMNTFEDIKSDNIEQIESIEQDEIEKDVKTEENVRNIFLESLAFIPELVTNNGNVNLEIPISDNITTWNIQTVGNSKEGRIGFANKSFKVFKEFFVDYSLPANTVVTDNISIPVTIYNYTENVLDVSLDVIQNDWANIGQYDKIVNVPANSTKMVYVPLEIVKAGENTLRIETKSGNVSDIVEKTITTNINGMKTETVISSGSMEKSLEQDIIFKESCIDETKKIKVKLYASAMSQIIENMESILKMPSGCFEQTSSSLYPDILALKYLKTNNLSNSEIEEKALNYISAGYQKLLTYEVPGKKGGYSLYGNSPAEPVITAFGLMEMVDLSEVYNVDENVIENMKEYLFDEQNINGSFNYSSTYIGNVASTDEIAMNAYIIWALSEACPDDSRLEKSIKYLENKLDDAKDNYTLALIANAFSNVKNKNTKKVIDRLMDNVIVASNESVYIESNNRDYWGGYGKNQIIQVSALTSLVLTKENSNSKTNSSLINYIIQNKDYNGSWNSTQATILALKAINEYNEKSDISNQKITVMLNGESKEIDVGENNLELYELEFSNVDVENKISISMKKGKLYYEIVKEYYKIYDQSETVDNKLLVEQKITQEANVNDIIVQNISLTNLSSEKISNAIVRINIPQGCSVIEESLATLKHKNIIEKYEYNYTTLDLYIRNFEATKNINLEINYRASYPEQITGAAIRAYDYYNPEIEGIGLPLKINVK